MLVVSLSKEDKELTSSIIQLVIADVQLAIKNISLNVAGDSRGIRILDRTISTRRKVFCAD
jgi:hypothetical protein